MRITLAIDGGWFSRLAFESGHLCEVVPERIAELCHAFGCYHEHVAMCWDAPPYWRTEFFPAYKAARHARRWERREEYDEQLKALKASLRCRQLQSRGYEADDVAATIARSWPTPIVLHSIDHDWLQLVAPGVSLLRTAESELITSYNIREATGLSAQEWFHVQCLMGCASDGVPGLKGIGLVRAAKLVLNNPGLVPAILSGEAQKSDDYLEQYCIDRRDEVVKTSKLVTLYTVGLEEIRIHGNPSSQKQGSLPVLQGQGMDMLGGVWRGGLANAVVSPNH